MKESSITINNQESEMWQVLLENPAFYSDLVRINYTENNSENSNYFVI